jgi:uncharacterized membrane protein YhdT
MNTKMLNKFHLITRIIGKTLLLISWCIVKFIVFSFRRPISAPTWTHLFMLSLIFAGLAAASMRISNKDI